MLKIKMEIVQIQIKLHKVVCLLKDFLLLIQLLEKRITLVKQKFHNIFDMPVK